MVITLGGTLLALRSLRREIVRVNERRNPLADRRSPSLIYVFLFAPIVVLIIFSFNQSRRNFVWLGFTTDWYPKLFANRDLLDALWVTVQVALVAVHRGDDPGHAARPRPGAAASSVARARPRRCSCCRWSRPRSSWASAC